MGPLLTSLIAILAIFTGLTNAQSSVRVDDISGQPLKGPSMSQLVSQTAGFDAPKISHLNSTSFDWWYWDVVASDLSATVAVTVFTADLAGLWDGLPDVGSAVWVAALISFPNGTATGIFIPGDSVTITTVNDGSSGTLHGLNGGWTGTPDMREYTVTINEPDSGIQGTLNLQSIAPAHFPCSANIDVAGQTLAVSPNFGWANAMPDANGTVDFIVDGVPLNFSGSGYHDKNWGAQPVKQTAQSWYWGHARVGPLSLVWFDIMSPDGVEHVSSYVARDGQVVTAACSGLRVRPTGTDVVFPPTPETFDNLPDGFLVDIDIPGEGEFHFEVTVTRITAIVEGSQARFIGSISGGPANDNSTRWEGVAVFEELTFDV